MCGLRETHRVLLSLSLKTPGKFKLRLLYYFNEIFAEMQKTQLEDWTAALFAGHALVWSYHMEKAAVAGDVRHIITYNPPIFVFF